MPSFPHSTCAQQGFKNCMFTHGSVFLLQDSQSLQSDQRLKDTPALPTGAIMLYYFLLSSGGKKTIRNTVTHSYKVHEHGCPSWCKHCSYRFKVKSTRRKTPWHRLTSSNKCGKWAKLKGWVQCNGPMSRQEKKKSLVNLDGLLLSLWLTVA